ncbi:aldo/keto reductase [Kitasatospora sp. NPDC047058]|uniref:aldo/keto reductase n=1 Tax=Kitasatospora sp. NPDC047058 TaxID=3155620 RepID=UPI0033C19A70
MTIPAGDRHAFGVGLHHLAEQLAEQLVEDVVGDDDGAGDRGGQRQGVAANAEAVRPQVRCGAGPLERPVQRPALVVQRLGQLLRHVNRSRLTISSKVGYFADTALHPYQAAQMKRQLLTSLGNLGTDYLDLYCLHSGDFGPDDRYLEEAVDLVQRLRREGLIRAIGMRAPHEFAAEWAADPSHPRAAETARFLTLFDRIQPNVLSVRYNLLSPVYGPGETDIFAFARQRQVGLLLKQVLGQGLLLGHGCDGLFTGSEKLLGVGVSARAETPMSGSAPTAACPAGLEGPCGRQSIGKCSVSGSA